MGFIRTFLPKPLHEPALVLLRQIRRTLLFGFARYCPVCRSRVRSFKRYGVGTRPDACCPVCGSFERFRFLWLLLDSRKDIIPAGPCTMLHFAPERVFEQRYRRIPGIDYLSADLDPAKAMARVDITDIPYPDNTFDVIHCSHVLEHIPDDVLAMRQLHRVLKPRRTAIIMVPITAHTTIEDPSVTDPAERLRLFGQHDHVRRYGPDVEQRLQNAGFEVECIRPEHFLKPRDIDRMRVSGEKVFLCKKT